MKNLELETRLFQAVDANNLKELRVVLKQKVDVDAADSLGHTALMYATMNRQTEAVKMLIEAGADVNKADRFGQTAIVMISDRLMPYQEIASVLIDAGADLNGQNKRGRTIAMEAARGSFYGDAILKKVIEKGADLDKQDSEGMTALMHTFHYNDTNRTLWLIEAGADIHKIDRDGKSALLYAAYSGDTQAALALIEKGADVNIRDNRGRSPLRLFFARRSIEMIEKLLDAGAVLQGDDAEEIVGTIHYNVHENRYSEDEGKKLFELFERAQKQTTACVATQNSSNKLLQIKKQQGNIQSR